MGNIKHGLEVLGRYIKIAPENPGVYRMLDANDKILYIGKAKNIKKRLISYSHFDKLPIRLQRMVAEIDKLEFIVVENESKALLLENELIKKLEPKYNILLKDDKSFPYICLDTKSVYPMLRKYRGARKEGYKYFGPFASGGAVSHVLEVLQKGFLLRTCSDAVFNSRTRPCLMYQIKRCSAPCVGKISEEKYRHLVDEVEAFLEGKNTRLQAEMSEKMREASENEDFEEAMFYRDRIRALTSIQQGRNLEYDSIKSADFVALYMQNDMASIQVFFIRGGQNCGNVSFFPKNIEGASESEIMEAFLSRFYTSHVPPQEIILADEIDAAFLEAAIGVKINSYSRGNKAKIAANVKENAKEALERKVALESSIGNNLVEMAKVFHLPYPPERIEIYDNSHTQGTYAIGAMVVATPEGFDKKSYRTFNIKNARITNDDFAMMREVLARRFAKLTPENKPDVILIDGGLGQLHAVLESLKEYDLSDIAVIAMSKGIERNAGKEFYHQSGRDSFELPFASKLAFYMQNLRDEAHRFAIGTHRKKRGKSMSRSVLDKIEGIGALRKKNLLNYFGSVEAISEASLNSIEKVSGISKKTAEKIFNHFHK